MARPPVLIGSHNADVGRPAGIEILRLSTEPEKTYVYWESGMPTFESTLRTLVAS